MNTNTLAFPLYEQEIRKGNQQALAGWWNIASECFALIKRGEYETVKQYSIDADRVSLDWGAKSIELYIGHVKWAMDQGWKMSRGFVVDGNGDRVKSMNHIRETRKGRPAVKKQEPKRMVKQVDEVLAMAKHLSKADRKRVALELLAMD